MSKKRYALIGIALMITLVASIPLGQWYHFRVTVPNESKRFLESGSSTEELEERVGRRGLVLEIGPADWVAIRYKDSHRNGIYSSSIARLSDGSWFRSNHHFCAAFSGIRHHLEMMEGLRRNEDSFSEEDISDLADSLRRELEQSPLHPLVNASTLADAKDELRQLGFRQVWEE